MRRVLLLLCLAGGCAHPVELRPAAGAQAVTGRPGAARQSAAGVQVVVDGDAWRGRALDARLTPVRVTLENHSGHPLRLSGGAFSVRTREGVSLAALPPLQVVSQLRVEERPVAPTVSYGGLFVGAPYAPQGPGIPAEAGTFADASDALDSASEWPTAYRGAEVLDRALPEGVLEDGGRAEGFVYFQGLRGEAPGVTFQAELVDADSGAALGQVRLPFQVTRGGRTIAQR